MAITIQDRIGLLQEKLSKTVNFLDYTGLTYEEIITKINEKVSSDPSFDNFRESAIAQTLFEIFAGAVDVVNYYLERRAEECFMDTAQLRSSVILLSKALGYVVTRPIPASSQIKMKIQGPLPSGVLIGNSIQIPSQTKFTYDGNPYILTDTFSYTLSADSNNNIPTSANYLVEVDIDPNIIQGEIIYKEIAGSTNQQIGQKFQTYKILDKTVSNLYGEEDIGAVGESFDGNTYIPSDNAVTLIGVGVTRESAEYYKIDRKSLLNWESLTSFTTLSATSNICLLRTTPDENIEIIFGDDKYAAIGAKTNTPNIYIQYLSTLGTKANKTGVIGDKVVLDGSIYTNNQVDVTSNISFEFISNIINGSDMESLESIKYNSPGIYYSLDRCVTAKDYVSYLKSLTSPFIVKNAIAWGEQEEIEDTGEQIGMYKFFNVVLYSLLGQLYNLNSDPNTLNDLSNVVLEPNYSSGTETQSSYFNIIVNSDPQKRLKDLASSATCENVQLVNNKLQDRSQITIKNVYISPIIQDFDIKGIVYLRKLSNINEVSNKITNDIYKFLDENADFHENIYKSNIVDIIQNYKEVVYTDIYFDPTSPEGLNSQGGSFWLKYDNYLEELQDIISDFCDLDPYGTIFVPSMEYNVLSTSGNPNFVGVQGHQLNLKGPVYTERNFYNCLMKKIYDNITITDELFDEMLYDVHLNFAKAIKRNLIDNNGNIIYDNYEQYVSLRNEIARLRVNLSYQYK